MAVSKHDLTIREISDRTRMAPETVRSWIKSGKLEARAIGPKRQYRVKPDVLEAFLDQH